MKTRFWIWFLAAMKVALNIVSGEKHSSLKDKVKEDFAPLLF